MATGLCVFETTSASGEFVSIIGTVNRLIYYPLPQKEEKTLKLQNALFIQAKLKTNNGKAPTS